MYDTMLRDIWHEPLVLLLPVTVAMFTIVGFLRDKSNRIIEHTIGLRLNRTFLK